MICNIFHIVLKCSISEIYHTGSLIIIYLFSKTFQH